MAHSTVARYWHQEREDEHYAGSGSEADPEIAEDKVAILKQPWYS